jgi:glyoxylase-like metal-dependent hydrolase (beta-lactamase superfamily II)/rhodanese-related sulfurtransferase
VLFEQIRSGGCLSYLIGCDDSCAALIVDPHLEQLDRYIAMVTERGMRVHYVAETHTHADHFSAARELGKALGARIVTHRTSPAPFANVRVDDGESLHVGKLRMRILHTPGHTADSMCFVFDDCVLTGDTLLIGGTGRTDLPTGDPDNLYDSLFDKLLQVGDHMKVYPAHDYRERNSSTIGAEKSNNARLQKKERADFVALMRGLDLKMPDHLTEALRTNCSGGKTVAQLIAEASREIAFMSLTEVAGRIERGAHDLVLLDVREKEAFDRGHLPGAMHLPRGQLELRVDKELPDPSARILSYCQFGRISTLSTATLRTMGFQRAVALDGGYDAWTEAGLPVVKT